MNEMRCFLKTKEGQAVVKKQENKKTFESDPRAIYQDHFVTVRSDFLIVKKYFLPSMMPYDFQWDKIQSITYKEQANEDKSKVRAKGMDDEGRWWAQDVLRPFPRQKHLYNIRIETDTEPPKSGFTVEDLDGFFTSCKPNLLYSCKIRHENDEY